MEIIPSMGVQTAMKVHPMEEPTVDLFTPFHISVQRKSTKGRRTEMRVDEIQYIENLRTSKSD